MVESVNVSVQVPVSSAQSTQNDEKNVQAQKQEENTTSSSVSQSSEDRVTINTSFESESDRTTTIRNAEEAQRVASVVVNLFQESPELAATAQGGNLTAEKADAYISANTGGSSGQAQTGS